MTATRGILFPATSINTAQAASSSSSSSSSSNSAEITAGDFLTLLVTELQNQDPTANNDPSEYINQLVGINSLEQLVSINQDLQTGLGIASSSAGSQSANEAGAALSDQARNRALLTAAYSQSVVPTTSVVNGNLSAPTTTHTADRLAAALSGQR